jgi:superfamily II DNA or RNA helicase
MLLSTFCLEEIAAERFLPCLYEVDELNVRSSWVFLQEQRVAERLSTFRQAMPPLCVHATSDDPTSIHETRVSDSRANDILAAYFSSFLTCIIEEGKGKSAAKIEFNHSVLMSQHIQLMFIMHLTSVPEFLKIDSALPMYHDTTRNLITWCQSSPFGTHEVVLCLYISIKEPGIPDGSWRLAYHLRPEGEDSYCVSADQIWDGDLESYSAIPPAFHLEEVLIREIGKAASICPLLDSSLTVLDPTHVDLSIEQFALFLTTYASKITEAGIGVDIPPWWTDKPIKPKVRVALAESVAGPRCGLETLIEYNYTIVLGEEEITFDDFLKRSEFQFTHFKDENCWKLVDPGKLQSVIDLLKKRDKAISPREILSLIAIDEQTIEFESENDWCSHFLKTACEQEEIQAREAPASFNGELRRYQESGLSFLLNSAELGYGVCLADDMGLGKTPQTIAYLLARKEVAPESTPSLVICPTSVAGNWEREIKRFGPSMKVYVHHGTDREKDEGFHESLSHVDLVITTYALAGRDVELFSNVHWSSMILDEAQNIKNYRTKQAKAVHSLPADHKIALTGTPIENRLSELWSIMHFLNKGYLGPAEQFKEMYAIPIERNSDTEKADELKRLIRPFMLRRVKSDPTIISDLPDKIETKVYCTLTQEQAALYQSVVENIAHSIENAAGIERRGIILASLTKLKEICDHPCLYLHEWEYKVARSGKVQRLVEMLAEVIESGGAAIVFTQYATFASELRTVLEDHFEETVLLLTGETSRSMREELIAKFMEPNGPKIFVLSLKAGGVGLNLTRANHVFHVDRWWNPAVENQATDRAFRIGQTQDVFVHLMIAAGTLEERIDSMLEEKRGLADQILGGGDDWLMSLSNNELLNVISLRESVFEE